MTLPAPRPLTVLTGHSRGMGWAMARQCLAAGHQVLGLARQRSDTLDALAAPGQLLQWQVDLHDATPAAEALADWLRAQDAAAFSTVTLINNAGVIAPLRPLHEVPLADTARALRVGLEATALLSSAFLAATADWPLPRRLLCISSGLGRRPMASSASYCAAKAGMDLLCRCVALEQAAQPNGARVVSLAPGVIDTDMQVQLRGADPAAFADRERFVQLQVGGQLLSTDEAARRVLAFLARPDFGTEVVADVRTA